MAWFLWKTDTIHLDEGIEGRPPEYVRPEQFVNFEYVFFTISE